MSAYDFSYEIMAGLILIEDEYEFPDEMPIPSIRTEWKIFGKRLSFPFPEYMPEPTWELTS